MLSIQNINPLVRAVGIFSAVAVIVTGATMAVFNTNTVALNDNSISVNQDVLRIWDGASFSTSATGFSFNVSAGSESSQQPFYLQNLGEAALTLSAQVAPSPDLQNIDDAKVHIKIFDKDGTTVLLDKTLAELTGTDNVLTGQLDALATGNSGASGTEGNFSLSVKVDADAPTDNPASVNNIDLLVTGTPLGS
jgi:hypothetical protein